MCQCERRATATLGEWETAGAAGRTGEPAKQDRVRGELVKEKDGLSVTPIRA